MIWLELKVLPNDRLLSIKPVFEINCWSGHVLWDVWVVISDFKREFDLMYLVIG